MKKRLIQIFGFLISSLGWLFILCTMAMDYWRISQIGGEGGSFIIKVAWYWSNLWKDCLTDSTAVTNCRDYGVLWSVLYYVQAVRGLLICGLTIGFFAVVCCFIGMECTYIGGPEPTKDKLVFSGAVFHFVGGVSNLVAYCLYINRVARTAFATNLPAGQLRYDLGPPIFLGLVGCFLIYFGAVLYAVTVIKVIYPDRKVMEVYGRPTYMPSSYKGRSLYTGYYEPSRLYGSYTSGRSSIKISRLSHATPKLSERDAFV
ncbi:claudin-10-like [Xiphophorus maculatus]|uniref:claudin-10-like n=1 Tax=Xiphophorus maculatus TaxID=8083 RepID=UPI0003B30EED|nr:claudin-10-like [Xiphophorus maculatus]